MSIDLVQVQKADEGPCVQLPAESPPAEVPPAEVPPAEVSPAPNGGHGAMAVTAIGVLVGGLLAVFGARPLSDNSFLTHLATGREIIESGLPRTNPFLYTGQTFPVPSYWWSIALAWVEKLGGAVGIRLLTAAIAGVLGVVLVRLGSRTPKVCTEDVPPRGLLATIVPVGFTLLCLFPFLNSRPHLPGFLLLALVILIWSESRSPGGLVPVFMIWVNVHGTWLYGLLVLGVLCVARAIDDRGVDRHDVLALGGAMLGTILGGALYPERFALLLLPTRQFGDPIEREAIRMYQEWKPVPFTHPLMWLLIGLVLVSVLGALRQRRWATGAAAVALFLLGISGFRLVPIAAISLVPFVATGMENIGSISMPSRRIALGIASVGAGLFLVAGLNSVRSPGYDLSMYPTWIIDRMIDEGLVGGDVRTLSHDYVGNYLEWRLGSEANTYVDDRPDAQTFVDYGNMVRLADGWREALANAEADVIIWSREKKMAGELSESGDWIEAMRTDDFVVFCSPEFASRCADL